MILFPVGPKCWHDWDQKLWRYLYCKYHFRANNRCDRNVPCLVSEQLIQGLHCSCLTPPVMVPTACRNDMISASIQQMLHLGVSFSDSPIWIYPWSPQKWARTRRGVSITEPVKEGSTVAITAEGGPQYHFYKVTGKQNTSELITDDYGTEFPQTLISYKAILSQRKFYRHDLQSCV